LAQAAAEHAPLMMEVLDRLSRPGEHGAGGGVEVFVERDVDGVEQRGVARRRYSRVGRGEKEAGAIEVEADPVLPCKSGNPLHLGKVEDLALEPAHRGFYAAAIRAASPVASS
jgi:hypothetical protein